MTTIIDGNKVASELFQTIRDQSEQMSKILGYRPKLALISISDGNLMIETAADLHKNCAERCGCDISNIILPSTTTQEQLCAKIIDLNFSDDVTAIMVFQPLPAHIDVATVVNTILPEKEIEGLHPINLARLFPTSTNRSDLDLCVPQALKILLSAYDIYTPGKRWVVLAQSELVESDIIAATNIHAASIDAMPVNSILTVVSPDRAEAQEICQSADYVLTTSRNTHWLDASWIKQGAVVIDFLANMVGQRPHPMNPEKKLPILKGSVDPEAIMGKAGYFCPVVGGVGPMLIASLFYNCMKMHERKLSIGTVS